MKKIKSKQVKSFKKGDQYGLDSIYDVQGLCGGDWWQYVWRDGSVGADPPGTSYGERLSDEIIILRDITITITEQ